MKNVHELLHFPIAPRAMRRANRRIDCSFFRLPEEMVLQCNIENSVCVFRDNLHYSSQSNPKIVLIYFFESFCIYYIPHNYVIPQGMPHALPHRYPFFLPSPLNVVLFPLLIVDCSGYTESCRFTSEKVFRPGKNE